MANPELIKAYTAGAAIAAHRIVVFGSADGAVIQAAASTDKLIGISEAFGAASGERIDIVRSGLADVEYGGSVTRGDMLTADANGKAVVAAPAAAVNAQVIGRAEVSGVAGDIGSVLICAGTVQG